MPNNENNFFNNNEYKNETNNNMPQTPQIEIPQKYYDQLEEEKQRKIKEAEEAALAKEQLTQSSKTANNMFLLILVSGLIIFGCLYLMVNKTQYALYALAAYIVIGAIFNGIKKKKESDFGTSILIGGIICAIISFVISLTSHENQDLWTYYAIASGVVAIIGLIISSLITLICYDHQNIKAVQTIGILLTFGVIVGGPIYLSKKYPQEFTEYVFFTKAEVVAETEEEFIIKTLKNRYSVEFTCGKHRNQIDNQKRLLTIRICTDSNNNKAEVISTTYNETDKKYIIQENYLENLYITKLKETIKNNLKSVTNSTIDISLYPKEHCEFVGDCINWEAGSLEEQYKASSNLELSEYINLDSITFANKYGFKYYIDVVGSFSNVLENDYITITNNILTSLNNMKIQNTNGFEISLIHSQYDLKTTVYHAIGETNSSKTFSNAIAQEVE